MVFAGGLALSGMDAGGLRELPSQLQTNKQTNERISGVFFGNVSRYQEHGAELLGGLEAKQHYLSNFLTRLLASVSSL